jgi:hypothetical protein
LQRTVDTGMLAGLRHELDLEFMAILGEKRAR